ncbi:hypothetical protein Cob_v008313 [Colletotrichum orbiculare MAFF 240422]|uniref:Uncharacterized protein n=1 Tax=Colletotrichum orbiculare (strain 104-T / ATCC 96160 / CBS 514.97 / LARS 414 / MAFF 240422) TaxID=1213857 RepID=N4VEW3_COLOR|nr:hypothetical protein Cob_v008313 [Colletotrichum orbiculare MAFF 240422]
MQVKIFTAAIAAFSFAPVQAAVAVAPRQAFTVTPGALVLPTFSFDPNSLGVQQFIFQLLNTLRGDIDASALLVTQLINTANNAANDRVTAAQAIAAALQQNAQNIATKFQGIVGELVTKAATLKPSATPGNGNGGGNGGGLPSPTLPSVALPTATVAATAADIAQLAEQVVVQVQTLFNQANGQVRALQAQATQQATGILGLVDATLKKLLGDASTATTAALQTAYAQSTIATQLLLATVAGVLANVQGTSAALTQRITNASVKLNPTLVLGVSPDIKI